MTWNRRIGTTAAALAAAVGLSGCGFTPYDLPLPGGADTGSDPYAVTVEFNDVLDLVPQSGVRVNDLAVGKVTDIQLDGWKAVVTLEINRDAKLPDNAVATIRQTSLLGEKFVSLAAPETGATGRLSDGDKIPLARSGRNPELEEVFSAQSLLFNGGGLERTNTIVKELGRALDGNEPEIKEFLKTTDEFLGQLDDNKESLLTSLEQVNRLAIATNKQKGAITGALDELPEGLRVINGQRDDLVELLQALDRLGDVATDVIRESKADTVANFKLLVPTLAEPGHLGRRLRVRLQGAAELPVRRRHRRRLPQGARHVFRTRPRSPTPASASATSPTCPFVWMWTPIRSRDCCSCSGSTSRRSTPSPWVTRRAAGAGQAPAASRHRRAAEGHRGSDAAGSGRRGEAARERRVVRWRRPTPGRLQLDGGSGGLLCGLFGSCRTAPASFDGGSADLATVLLQPAVAP